MNYYWFNRQELFKKTGEKYHNCCGKEKAAEYYQVTKDIIKQKANNKYNNLAEEEKEPKRKYSKNRYKQLKENQDKL